MRVPIPEQWDSAVNKGIAYLRTTQADDGSWSSQRSPGVTGVVLTALLRTGKVSQDDPMATQGLAYVESLVNPKEHHIAGKDAACVQLKNYVTSVNVMALSEANREERYKKVIGDAAEFLKQLQWDEEEGKQPSNDFYGGAGYDSKSRPDLSNTQFFLDALVAAGVPKDDPALKKALLFVSRCQNLKGEYNDQPWAGKINDGSFIYSAAGGGQTKVEGYTGRRLSRLRQHDLRRHQEHDLLRRLQRRLPRQEGLRVDSEALHRGRESGHAEVAGSSRPVLLLPHHGQVPGRTGR